MGRQGLSQSKRLHNQTDKRLDTPRGFQVPQLDISKISDILIFMKEDVAEQLKTNYKDPSKRYEMAERVIWSKTPPWKRNVIAHCKLAKAEDRILDEYAQSIVTLAESSDLLKNASSLPPVPSFNLTTEIEIDKELTKK